jgi:hypothetical protein
MNEWGFSPTLNWLALEEIVRIKKAGLPYFIAGNIHF